MLTNSQLYHNKLCIFAAFNFVIVLFWSMSPYIRWLVPSELALFLLLASTMISTLSLKQYVPECLCVKRNKKNNISEYNMFCNIFYNTIGTYNAVGTFYILSYIYVYCSIK